MLTTRDFEILDFFSRFTKPMKCTDIPFELTELSHLAKLECLTVSDALNYNAPGEYPLSVKAYKLSPLGKAALEDFKTSRAKELKSHRISVATLIFTVISLMLALLSLLLPLLR